MRAVTTATAAAALRLERKTLDNILSRLGNDVFPKGRQGRERRIPVSFLPELLLTTELAGRLGVPVKEAFVLARRLVRGEPGLGPFIEIRADLPSVQAALDRQLERAIESVVRKPRGRPRNG